MGDLRTNDEFGGRVIALGTLANVLRLFGGDTNEDYYAHLLVGRVTTLLLKSTMITLGEARYF